jgi:hypothetical protein
MHNDQATSRLKIHGIDKKPYLINMPLISLAANRKNHFFEKYFSK